MKKNEGDFYLDRPYARIFELPKYYKQTEPQRECIRVYPQGIHGFTFQIRTSKKINENGKPRNMIASVDITMKEMKKIMKYMEQKED